MCNEFFDRIDSHYATYHQMKRKYPQILKTVAQSKKATDHFIPEYFKTNENEETMPEGEYYPSDIELTKSSKRKYEKKKQPESSSQQNKGEHYPSDNKSQHNKGENYPSENKHSKPIPPKPSSVSKSKKMPKSSTSTNQITWSF